MTLSRTDVRARLEDWAAYEDNRAETSGDAPGLRTLHRERAAVYRAAIAAIDAEVEARRLLGIAAWMPQREAGDLDSFHTGWNQCLDAIQAYRVAQRRDEAGEKRAAVSDSAPKPGPKEWPEAAETTREEREAAALRENLKRRKQQARERAAQKPAPDER